MASLLFSLVVTCFLIGCSHAAMDLVTVNKIYADLKLKLEALDKQLADQSARLPAQEAEVKRLITLVKEQQVKICKLKDKLNNEKNECPTTEAILQELKTQQAVDAKTKELEAKAAAATKPVAKPAEKTTVTETKTKEVVFAGLKSGVNVALKKPASQSSTYGSGAASRAVDGNTSPDYAKKSCSHADKQKQTWWCVDLQKTTNIALIELVNRNSIQQRLKGFTLKIGSSGKCDAAGFKAATPCYKDKSTANAGRYKIKGCNVGDDKLMSGRFVFVENKEFLTLCEVQIFEGVNVALKKPASQSSTYPGGVASLAVDGNTSPEYAKKSCSHTNKQKQTWWCVDLQKTTNMALIELVNRNTVQKRLTGFTLKIGSSGKCDAAGFKAATPCYKDKATSDAARYKIKGCNVGDDKLMSGRFVFVENKEFLTLCEVQIYEGISSE